MKKKVSIVVAILLFAVGFAAISTTLIINGSTKVSENADDFSVIFTAATLDGTDVYLTVVDDTRKTITFETSELKTLNQTSVLNYEITNNSSNYDAEVQVTCKIKGDATAKYTSIKNEFEGNATVVKAKETLNGILTVTLNKTATEEVREEYVCTLEFNAVERNEIGKTKNNYILTKAVDNTNEFAEIGDTISIGNEKFYVISNIEHKIAALAYYNLNVGDYKAEGNVGIQNSLARGYYAGDSSYKGIISFANSNGWNYLNNDPIDIKKFDGQIKSALYDENNGYEKYLKSFDVDVSARLILVDELERLGCSMTSQTCKSSNYPWLYSSSYWTGSASSKNSTFVWFVHSDKSFISHSYSAVMFDGLRPVIEFSENI